MRAYLIFSLYFFIFISTISCFPQSQAPEINDQFKDLSINEILNKTQNVESELNETKLEEPNANIDDILVPVNNTRKNSGLTSIEVTNVKKPSFITTFYVALRKPVVRFIESPKVNIVLRNIGTCVVNGAMEIVSYYFPAPLIPLIASAAGMFIPFEPVVSLRNKLPVTSYRRAFNSAVNSFMGTFDRFKTSDEDPYMTRRFNRRFMDNSKEPSK